MKNIYAYYQITLILWCNLQDYIVSILETENTALKNKNFFGT